jgi:Mrp family chromosome partitioning ATPase
MEFKKEKANKNSNLKNIIAVMSGKGGVGKSSVTSLIAMTLKNQGYNVGILDADITGPSIPKVFGINKKRASGTKDAVEPVETATGIKVISINLLVDNEESPVVWRGPVIANTVKQFLTEVNWGELDYLLIDLPPGTGDVPLTIMQSFELDGIVIVSSPQDLVKLIVKKSMNMAGMLSIPILGIVENMSYITCPDCNKKIHLFGESKVPEISEETGVKLVAQIPIDPKFVELCDEGKIELYLKHNYDFADEFSEGIKDMVGGISKSFKIC